MPDNLAEMTADTLVPPPANPSSPFDLGRAAAAGGRALAPNIMSLLGGEEAPPPPAMREAPGKTPSTDDPRVTGAIGEGAEMGMAALPFMMPGGAIAGPARSIEGMLARGATRAAESRPGAIAGSAVGMTAASAEPAEAAKLTRKQQQELEMKKQQLQTESQDAISRSKALSEQAADLERRKFFDAAEAKRLEAEDAAKIAINKEKEEAELIRKHETEMANRPFREKFPNLANAATGAGLTMAALLPYGTRLWQANKASNFAQAWENVATRAEQALAKGNMPEARLLVDQLSGFKKQAAQLEKAEGKKGSNMGLNAASAAIPLEFMTAPEAIDLVSGSPQAKDRAKDTLLDPIRVPAALAQGATAAALGAKAPLLGRNKVPPVAQTEGAMKSFKTLSRQRIESAKKAGKKLTPVDHNPFEQQ